MPKRFHTWFFPLLATLLIFIGGVASNWVAADLQDNLEPYRPWVWGLFGVALLTTLYMAWRETRLDRQRPALPPPMQGRDVIGGDQVGRDKVGGDALYAAVSESENTIIGTNNVQTVIQQAVIHLAQAVQSRTLDAGQVRTVATLYLEQLVNRYRFLDFKGMGVTDRVALQLPLLEMYVPLRARRELPAGDTAARTLRLAGRPVSDAEAAEMGQHLTEPLPVIDLLQQHAGVIVLGDPGAGKTTFLKYLALLLAFDQGDRIGLAGYLPLLIPLAAYANRLEQGDIALQDFLGDYYRGLGIPLPIGDLLSAVLTQGRALLLMDGLDEVQSLVQRTTLVRRFEEFFAFHHTAGNKFVLTSRIVGYRELRPSVAGLIEGTLVDFDDGEIEQFVAKWSQALERAVQGDNAVAQVAAQREGGELLAAIRRNPGVGQLATNPLLLTILALMKRQGVSLPERRAQLYDTYLKTLLRTWNLARSLDGRPQREVNDSETLRVLAPLALWMHESSPGVGLVKREKVRRKLIEIYQQRGAPDAEDASERLLADVHKYTSLLLERGPGEYGFIHLTFQEYLAAVAVVQQGQQNIEPIVTALTSHLGQEGWREVTLLAVGYLGLTQQREEAASDVVLQLAASHAGEPGAAVVLAGEAVRDVQPDGVTAACKAQILDYLRATMTDAALPARTRLDAGLVAADLGDLPPDLDALIAMPAQAQPGYDFRIGQYPVTNHQYRHFVRDGGYAPENEARWWSEKGRGYKQQYDWTEPRLWNNDQYNRATQPVIAVSWYEAEAYCAWLTEQWRVAGLISQQERVRLPTQAEWIFAARGGRPEPTDKKSDYPWRGAFDATRANTAESNLEQTTPVHLYPQGVTPEGMWDMAGNVWEWTLDEQSRDEDGTVWYYLKGGSYWSKADNVTASAAYLWLVRSRYDSLGLRVVVVPISR